MQRLDVSGAVRPIYGSLGVKRLISNFSRSYSTARDHIFLDVIIFKLKKFIVSVVLVVKKF
jgi:hypothetical protein